VACGADVSGKDRFDSTPLDDAKREKHKLVVNYFKSNLFAEDRNRASDPIEFRFFDRNHDGLVSTTEFHDKLAKFGIDTLSDPRIKNVFEATSADITPSNISRLVVPLVGRVCRGEVTIPQWNNFTHTIDNVFAKLQQPTKNGKFCTEVPYLSQHYTQNNLADSFLLNLRTVDGQVYEKGGSGSFTLQGMVSLINYCIALEIIGSPVVHSAVGFEPSGDPIDSLTLNLNDQKKKIPHNPFTHAGSIVLASLLYPELGNDKRVALVQDWCGKAGLERPVVNQESLRSHTKKSSIVNAIAHLLVNEGALNADLDATVDFYLSVCSLEWSLNDLSIFGATLANNGVNPLTEKTVFSPETVKNALSMMYCCGMNTHTGEFGFSVGMPGKSSISGVNLAIVPNVLSFASFSAKLNEHGNSAKSTEFLTEVTNLYNLHIFEGGYKKVSPTVRVDQNKLDTAALLSYAAIGAAPEIIAFLEEHAGLDINVSDYDRRSMAHVAVAEGKADVIQLLQKKGANFTLPDRWGKSALDEAVARRINN